MHELIATQLLDFDLYRSALYAFLCSAGVVVLLTPLVMQVAGKVGAVDDPGEERRVHTRPTPRMGGVAMLAGILVSCVVFIDFSLQVPRLQMQAEQLTVALVCAVFVCLLGAVDDVVALPWFSKLGGQIGIALAVVLAPLLGPTTNSIRQLILAVRVVDPPLAHAVIVPPVVGIALAVLWIVAMMNMVNFIDGVDGLAAGVCSISAMTFAVIAASYHRADVAVLAAAVSGAGIGFLRYNFRKGGALVFMGDSGSMLLGFLLAVIAIQGVLKTAAAISLVIPLALLAVPILDTMFVVSKRLKHKQPVSNADRWHLHHRLLNVGYSPRRVAVAFWGWTASMSAVAIALRYINYGNSRHWERTGLLVLGAVALLAAVASVVIAVQLEIIKTRSVRDRNRQIALKREAERRVEAEAESS